MSMTNKIIILVGLIVVIASTSVGIGILYRFDTQLQTQTMQRLQDSSTIVASNFNRSLKVMADNVRILASEPAL